MVEKSVNLKAIGKRIRYWRKEVRGLTLQNVAEMIGSSHSALAKLETGDAGMSLERIERLADALRLPVGFIADPSMQYVPVHGFLTGAGTWTKDPGPWFGKFGIYPMILPNPIGVEEAIAFERVGQDGFVICAPLSGEPVENDPYLVLRKTTAGALDLDENDEILQNDEGNEPLARTFRELAQRRFNQESATTLDTSSHSSNQTLRRSARLGRFIAKSGPPEDLSVARNDPGIEQVWRVIGGFRIDPQSD